MQSHIQAQDEPSLVATRYLRRLANMSDKDPEPSPPIPQPAAAATASVSEEQSSSISRTGAAAAATSTSIGAAGEDDVGERDQLTQQTDESVAPPFEPLFTLLTNTTTGSTVHPRVQYLFSDDDTSILSNPPLEDDNNGSGEGDGGGGDAQGLHRTVVVDLVPTADNTGWAVSWASSLSPSFAITNSDLGVQQGDGGDGDGSLMLRLEGVDREPVEFRPDSLPSSGSGALGRDDVDSLADEFRRRMGVLKKVVGESEKRRDALARQEAAAASQPAGAVGGREELDEAATAGAAGTSATDDDPADNKEHAVQE